MALPSGTTAGSGHAHTSETASMRTLQEAAALDLSKLSGAGGPTYLIIYLHNLQAALAEAQVVSTRHHRYLGESCPRCSQYPDVIPMLRMK